MFDLPLVSIVIPIYNSEDYLDAAIRSVLNQTYEQWELWLVDDCSVDRSAAIAQKHAAADERIHYERLKVNSGAAIARNVGISRATGRYLCFLDADDLWHPEKLEQEVSFITKKNCKIVFCAYDMVDSEGNSLHKAVYVPERINYKTLLYNNIIFTSTVLIDISYFGKFEMPNLRAGQDLATWLMLLKRCDYAYGLNEILASYRQVSTSISHSLKNRIVRTWNVYRKAEKLSIIKSSYYYLLHTLITLKKRKRVR